MQADSRLVQAWSWSRSRRWRSTRIRVAATMAYRTCHAMTSGRSMLAIEQTRCASTARGADHLVEHGERVRHAQRCAMNRAGIDGVVQTEHAARMVESVRRPAVRAVECHAPSRTRSAMGPSPKGVPGEATTLGAGEESPVLRAAIRSGSTEARNEPTTTAGSRRSGRASLGTPRGYADVPLALRTPVGHRAAMVPYPSLPVMLHGATTRIARWSSARCARVPGRRSVLRRVRLLQPQRDDVSYRSTCDAGPQRFDGNVRIVRSQGVGGRDAQHGCSDQLVIRRCT